MLTKRIIICNLYEYSYHLLPGRIGAAPEAVVTCMYEGGVTTKPNLCRCAHRGPCRRTPCRSDRAGGNGQPPAADDAAPQGHGGCKTQGGGTNAERTQSAEDMVRDLRPFLPGGWDVLPCRSFALHRRRHSRGAIHDFRAPGHLRPADRHYRDGDGGLPCLRPRPSDRAEPVAPAAPGRRRSPSANHDERRRRQQLRRHPVTR